MRKLSSILIILFSLSGLFLLSTGCKDLLTEHNIDIKGVMHGKKLYKGAKNCTACHGTNLNGNGPVPGCYSCHDALWQTDDHTNIKGGVAHKPSMTFSTTCTDCHGTDLKGSMSRPSCYSCHDDVWTDLETRHTDNVSGSYHGPNRTTPNRDCAGCHGTDLDGSANAPSCYSCHYNKWDGAADHDVLVYGVGHKAQYNNPLSSDCTDCHGSNLKGSKDAPSCYTCHGAKWN
ncbi:MAG: cytochrome c3 family protein [SAR324 cluster bacterium]|nr:cytochrome c3 family protein [SAR324 cluster bacterium]